MMKTERLEWEGATRVTLPDGRVIVIDDHDLRRFASDRRSWEAFASACVQDDVGFIINAMPSLIDYARIE